MIRSTALSFTASLGIPYTTQLSSSCANVLAPPSNLTRAELEALRMVKDGQKLKEIGTALGITEGAVKQRLKNARLKLGARNGSHAVSLATAAGLI